MQIYDDVVKYEDENPEGFHEIYPFNIVGVEI